ncbi:MAG: ribosomal RNA small subunit methyltransferase A, partial [Pirellulales bacterium]|nr:ribosomal RNA small subunit methyltransferase A [Pirellulales bacterium]
IWIQSQCTVQIARVLPPSVFWPAPKVHSAIIRIDLDPSRRDRIPDPGYFHQFIKAMFFHRRKFLRSNLAAAMKRYLTKEQVDTILADLGFGPETRAEQLDVPALMGLCEAVRMLAPDWHL